MPLFASLATWSVVLVLASPSASAAPSSHPSLAAECESLEKENAPPGTPAELTEAHERLARAYAKCGAAYGFLAKAGLLYELDDKFDLAADAFSRELLERGATDAAFEGMIRLFPRLEGETRQKIERLGSTPDLPIHLRHQAYDNEWTLRITCLGTPPVDAKRERHGQLTKITVECPKTVTRHYYYRRASEDGAARALTSDTTLVDGILAKLKNKFGIETAEDLRRAVLADSRTRSDAWLYSWIGDHLTRQEILRAIADKDPADFEAVVGLAIDHMEFGDPRRALQTLDGVNLDELVIRDTRASGIPVAGYARRCQFLLLLGRHKEAKEACRVAIEKGSESTANYLMAQLLYLEGKHKEAIPFAMRSIGGRYRTAEMDFQAGLILAARDGSNASAQKAWAYALKSDPEFMPAALALSGVSQSPSKWVGAINAHRQLALARKLARCGHVYLDLDLPQRAEKCFAASVRLRPGPEAAQRVAHLGETDPAAAMTLAMKLLKKTQHPDLLAATAALHAAANRPSEALHWLDHADRADPANPGVRTLLPNVCGNLSLGTDCLQTFRKSPATGRPPWERGAR